LKPLKQEKIKDWDEEDKIGYMGEKMNKL